MGLDIYLQNSNSVFSHKYYAQCKEALKFHPASIKQEAIYQKQKSEYDYSEKSANYPEHLCTPYYLRSSYNDGGYESKAELYHMMSLYDIFDPIIRFNEIGLYTDCTVPKLYECLSNAIKNKQMWDSIEDKQFDMIELPRMNNDKGCILTKTETIEQFTNLYNERKNNNIFNFPYTNDNKSIVAFTKPIEIYGFVQYSIPNFLSKTKYCEDPEYWNYWRRHYIVVKESIVWYKQMADIIIEFIRKALSMDDPEIIFWG